MVDNMNFFSRHQFLHHDPRMNTTTAITMSSKPRRQIRRRVRGRGRDGGAAVLAVGGSRSRGGGAAIVAKTMAWILLIWGMLPCSERSRSFIPVVSAANDDGYNNYYYYGGGGGDDNNNGNGDDDVYYNNNADDGGGGGGGDDDGGNGAGDDKQVNYKDLDDDTFHWNANVGFEGVSVMPISCINYNNGHVIKFELFDTAQSYQCHFAEISTFVVSIAHYMRAYFNYEALTNGKDFDLPSDAAYLNCIQLQETAYTDTPLYAKVGCMERATFTSTRLQLHVYTDEQCSQKYEDGQSARRHGYRGYQVGDMWVSSKVSFKPPFYACTTCAPEEVAATFNKKNSNWYDDDYISKHGNKAGNDDNNNEGGEEGDDDSDDDHDDKYLAANDDVYRDDDGGGGDDDNDADDYYNRRRRQQRRQLTAPVETLKAYHDEFWSEINAIKSRILYDNYYDIGEWNMCQRIYKYGIWCDEECRKLDFFRRDQWSVSDIILLAIMVTFLTAMMLLVVAKRLKAQQKARIYGEDQPMPGLPPFAMAIIFSVIMAVIITLAKLKFINETLVFAVVTCILLFIYMLKLTLFENRRPVLLAAPRHDMFDNPLDDHLFE